MQCSAVQFIEERNWVSPGPGCKTKRIKWHIHTFSGSEANIQTTPKVQQQDTKDTKWVQSKVQICSAICRALYKIRKIENIGKSKLELSPHACMPPPTSQVVVYIHVCPHSHNICSEDYIYRHPENIIPLATAIAGSEA